MARKIPQQPALDFTEQELAAMAKPPSPLSQLNIAFWFLNKIGNADRARVLLEIATDAQHKLSLLND